MTTITRKGPPITTNNIQNNINTPVNETKEEKIARLQKEKNEAVTAENYERAKELKDEIDWLEWVSEEPWQKLFDAYEERNKKTQGKTFKSPEMSFWKYMRDNKLNENKDYPFNAIMAIFPKLEDKNNLEDIKKAIQDEKNKNQKTQAQTLQDEKDSEMERLQKGLQDAEGKNEWLSKSKEQMKKWFAILRQKGKEEIEKIRNSEWTERNKLIAELKKTQEETKKLKEENTKLKNTVFGDAKYENNIMPEDLKKIKSMVYNRWYTEKDRRGIETKIAYQKIPLVIVKRRMTIKTIGQILNNIKDDAVTWVDFIMAFKKTRFARYTTIDNKMARIDLLRKTGAGRNIEKFWEKFHKKKDMIMNIITWGTPIDSLPEEERKVLKAIDQRMEFHGKKYLQDIYQGTNKKQ